MDMQSTSTDDDSYKQSDESSAEQVEEGNACVN